MKQAGSSKKIFSIFSYLIFLSFFLMQQRPYTILSALNLQEIGEALTKNIGKAKIVQKDLEIKGNETITYGCTVRLVHLKTQKALVTSDETYSHKNSSGQHVVYGVPVADDATQYWFIKGPHIADRWNAQLGRPVMLGATLRFENVAKARNLHSHRAPAPITSKNFLLGQYEVTTFGINGVGDPNDNFVLEVFKSGRGGSRGVLCNGSIVRLRHNLTRHYLHSHDKKFMNNQEVTGYSGRDDNDWWIVQLVKNPREDSLSAGVWNKQRGATLDYKTLVWIDPLNTGFDVDREEDGPQEFINHPEKNNRRLWTHGASRHAHGKTPEPGRHVELLSGPWKDQRTQGAASWFMIVNADKPDQDGAINYGDRIRILSVFASPGDKNMSGKFDPAKIWWVNSASRHKKTYHEIVISHQDISDTKTEKSIFVFESIMPRLSGPIYQNDAVQIRSMGEKKGVLWLHADSRLGDRYFEILINNNDDPGGISRYKLSRDNIFHRFYIRPVIRDFVPKTFQGDLDIIVSDLKAKKAEVDKIQADLQASEAKRLQEAAQVELKRVQEESVKKLEEASTKDEAEKKRLEEELARIKQDAQKALKDAEDRSQAQLKAALEAQKTVFDTQKEELQSKIDEAMATELELERLADLPVGFVEIPGKAVDVSLDLIEVGKGKDRKSALRAWAVNKDGALMLWKEGINPWYSYPLKDDKNASLTDMKIRSVSMGDEVVYVIDQNGKAWRHNSAEGAQVIAPIFGKKVEEKAIKKKAKKAKKSRKTKKDKKDKSRKTKAEREQERVQRWEKKQKQKAQKRKAKKQKALQEDAEKEHAKEGL